MTRGREREVRAMGRLVWPRSLALRPSLWSLTKCYVILHMSIRLVLSRRVDDQL
jgi:hypothetical protein